MVEEMSQIILTEPGQEIVKIQAERTQRFNDQFEHFGGQPIPYTPFDAEKEIRALVQEKQIQMELGSQASKNDIPDKLLHINRALLKQKTGLGSIIQNIKIRIEIQPDVEAQELFNSAWEINTTNNLLLTKKQLTYLFSGIYAYTQQHARVTEAIKIYKADARELFYACFDTYPSGQIAIEERPANINFLLLDPTDYETAANYNRVNKIDTTDDLAAANMQIKEPLLQNAVTLTKAKIDDTNIHGNRLIELSNRNSAHEEQHILNNFFSPLETQLDISKIMTAAVGNTKHPERVIEKTIHSLAYLKRRRSGFDARVRSEILAHLRNDRSVENIRTNILEYYHPSYLQIMSTQDIKENTSPMQQIAHSIQQLLSEYLLIKTHATTQSVGVSLDHIISVVEKVFGEEGKRDINRWINAIELLESRNYFKEEIISLLYSEPINRWHNLAGRLAQ